MMSDAGLPRSANPQGRLPPVYSAEPKVAQVRVATELYGDEVEDLCRALERVFGEPLEVRLSLDPRILGGVWVRVDDSVIDGSLRGRLETLRHHLTAQCRAMLSTGMTPPAETREDLV